MSDTIAILYAAHCYCLLFDAVYILYVVVEHYNVIFVRASRVYLKHMTKYHLAPSWYVLPK